MRAERSSNRSVGIRPIHPILSVLVRCATGTLEEHRHNERPKIGLASPFLAFMSEGAVLEFNLGGTPGI